MRQFFQAPADRAGGNAGRLYNRGNPAIAGRARLAGGEQSPPSFIQMRRYSSVAVADTGDIDHAGELHTRPVTAEPPTSPASATRFNYFLTGAKPPCVLLDCTCPGRLVEGGVPISPAPLM